MRNDPVQPVDLLVDHLHRQVQLSVLPEPTHARERDAGQNLCMTEALSENLIALLRAFTGISNLAITRPVRIPANNNKRMVAAQYQIKTCHNHARDALHESEEDNDGAVGFDVAKTIPAIYHPF